MKRKRVRLSKMGATSRRVSKPKPIKQKASRIIARPVELTVCPGCGIRISKTRLAEHERECSVMQRKTERGFRRTERTAAQDGASPQPRKHNTKDHHRKGVCTYCKRDICFKKADGYKTPYDIDKLNLSTTEHSCDEPRSYRVDALDRAVSGGGFDSNRKRH